MIQFYWALGERWSFEVDWCLFPRSYVHTYIYWAPSDLGRVCPTGGRGEKNSQNGLFRGSKAVHTKSTSMNIIEKGKKQATRPTPENDKLTSSMIFAGLLLASNFELFTTRLSLKQIPRWFRSLCLTSCSKILNTQSWTRPGNTSHSKARCRKALWLLLSITFLIANHLFSHECV